MLLLIPFKCYCRHDGEHHETLTRRRLRCDVLAVLAAVSAVRAARVSAVRAHPSDPEHRVRDAGIQQWHAVAAAVRILRARVVLLD